MEQFSQNMELYLQEIMRNVASSLMIPVMIVLVCLILFAVYSIGSLIAEFVIERRHFKANMPRDIKLIKDATYDELPDVIERTGLLRRQKEALQVVAANMGLPEDDLFALAKAEVSATDSRYRRKVARTDLVTKIAPMMGLMCTLIPLGPGIVAMGQGEVNLLSNSLLVAFDGTVAGLIGGVVSMVVSSVRKRWYANYLVATESLMTCVLEKAQQARAEGVELPYEGDIRAKADAMRSGATKPSRKKRGADAGGSSRRSGKRGNRAYEPAAAMAAAATSDSRYADAPTSYNASSSFEGASATLTSAQSPRSPESSPAFGSSALSQPASATQSALSGQSVLSGQPDLSTAQSSSGYASALSGQPSQAFGAAASAGYGAMSSSAQSGASTSARASQVGFSIPQTGQPTGSFGEVGVSRASAGGAGSTSGVTSGATSGAMPGAMSGSYSSTWPAVLNQQNSGRQGLVGYNTQTTINSETSINQVVADNRAVGMPNERRQS